MKELIVQVARGLRGCKDLPPLLFRLTLAYGFYQPAYFKLFNHAETARTFASLNIPFPEFSSYLVAVVEALGVPLLLLGLMTRWISSLLSIVMLVAIFAVHLPTHTDFTLPLCFVLTLFSLMVTGAGKYSLDYHFCWCEKAFCEESKGCCGGKSSKAGCCETSTHTHQIGGCSDHSGKHVHSKDHDKPSGGCCRH